MTDGLRGRRVASALRGILPALLVWPGACLVIAIALAVGLSMRESAEHAALQQAALNNAGQLAQGYASQLRRSVGQVDQLLRLTEFQWWQSGGKLRLAEQANRGLYPFENELLLGVVDKTGRVVSALRQQGIGLDVSGRNYFTFHKNNLQSDLFISPLSPSLVSNQVVISFSRALRTPQGGFEGVVLVAVKPEFLLSSYGQLFKSESDMLVLATDTGVPLVSQEGKAPRGVAELLTHTKLQLPSKIGASVLEGSNFADQQAHTVAWTQVPGYPLVAIAALSDKTVYAPYEAMRALHRQILWGSALALTLIALVGMYGTARHMLRRRQHDFVKSIYRLATDNAKEAFFMLQAVTDKAGRPIDFIVEDCNQPGAQFFERAAQGVVGKRLSELYPERFAAVAHIFEQALASGFREDEFALNQPGRPTRWMHRRVVGAGRGLAVTIRDITADKEHAAALDRMANTDELTEVPNRHWLVKHLPQFITRAKEADEQLAVLYLDLDGFKDINNAKGHVVGDAVLHAAAQRIRQALRPQDRVARLGGDEFVVLLPNVSARTNAVKVAQRLIKTLSQSFATPSRGEHKVSASVGISFYPEHGADQQELLLCADVAMYAAKNSGKGRALVYTPAMSQQVVQKFDMEQALREALEQDQFLLHYQPRVDTQTGALLGMEALLRWQRPGVGLVPPGEFIPVAEDTGLIAELGALVVEKVCAQLAAWRDKGIPLKPVSLNVSPKQFTEPDLKTTVLTSLSRHQIPPQLIELEITESCMMTNTAEVSAKLAVFKALGVRVSVDDFGTGYSSLSQLQRLDIDVLKVDRSFTSLLTTGEQGLAFFRTIMSLGHTLGMQVVAEGVETEEQLRILQALGCNETQGYLFSRPVPADEAEVFLRWPVLQPLAKAA